MSDLIFPREVLTSTSDESALRGCRESCLLSWGGTLSPGTLSGGRPLRRHSALLERDPAPGGDRPLGAFLEASV